MKRLICLLLAAVLLLAGCAGQQQEQAEMQPLSELVEAPKEPEPVLQQEPAVTPEAPAEQQEETDREEEPEVIPEELPEDTPEEIPEEEDDGLPNVDPDSWELILANASHNIEEYTPETELVEGQPVDARIVEPLNAFVAAARAEGLNVYLSSAYRDA